jgi:hypothetical protein
MDLHGRRIALVAALALAGCGGDSPSPAPRPPQTDVGRGGPGQTLAAFATSERAPKALAALAGAPVVLDEKVTARFAIAAVARGERAFAAALRFEGRRWRVLLHSPVRLHAVRPNPGERVRARTQVAADISANAPIAEAGMWFDGRALPAHGGGFDRRHLTMWQEAPQPLRRGHHLVVAYASTETDASAVAWTFVVR